MAAVMEKAGCPIPAEMQQLVERALDFYHWVWSSPDFWGETVKHGETWWNMVKLAVCLFQLHSLTMEDDPFKQRLRTKLVDDLGFS